MENYESHLKELEETIYALNRLRDSAFAQYTTLVDSVLRNEITDQRQLERIMDGLLDFCDEERFLQIYKKLCRHIFYRHPQMVGEHIRLFRAQFEDADEPGSEE